MYVSVSTELLQLELIVEQMVLRFVPHVLVDIIRMAIDVQVVDLLAKMDLEKQHHVLLRLIVCVLKMNVLVQMV